MFSFFSREEKQYIQLPKNIEAAKNLGKVLQKYKERHYAVVLGGYFITYILYPCWLAVGYSQIKILFLLSQLSMR